MSLNFSFGVVYFKFFPNYQNNIKFRSLSGHIQMFHHNARAQWWKREQVVRIKPRRKRQSPIRQKKMRGKKQLLAERYTQIGKHGLIRLRNFFERFERSPSFLAAFTWLFILSNKSPTPFSAEINMSWHARRPFIYPEDQRSTSSLRLLSLLSLSQDRRSHMHYELCEGVFG